MVVINIYSHFLNSTRKLILAGVTLRGDFEILAYNIVYWLTSKLPWEGLIKDCLAVQKAKESAMQNVSQFLMTCFGKKQVPGTSELNKIFCLSLIYRLPFLLNQQNIGDLHYEYLHLYLF